MKECDWDPKKHGGKPCPTHGGGVKGNSRNKDWSKEEVSNLAKERGISEEEAKNLIKNSQEPVDTFEQVSDRLDDFDNDYESDFEEENTVDMPDEDEGVVYPSEYQPESNRYNMTNGMTPDKFNKDMRALYSKSVNQLVSNSMQEHYKKNMEMNLENLDMDFDELISNDKLNKPNLKKELLKYKDALNNFKNSYELDDSLNTKVNNLISKIDNFDKANEEQPDRVSVFDKDGSVVRFDYYDGAYHLDHLGKNHEFKTKQELLDYVKQFGYNEDESKRNSEDLHHAHDFYDKDKSLDVIKKNPELYEEYQKIKKENPDLPHFFILSRMEKKFYK